MLEAKKLDETYETIIDNRVNFYNDCLLGYGSKFLWKWNILRDGSYPYHGRFTKEFIEYIIEKEDITEEITHKTVKKRFRKEKRVQVSKDKEIVKNLKAISELDSRIPDFNDCSIQRLGYNNWHKFREAILLVKKQLENYLVAEQKKSICILTDCYKENPFGRLCELCGVEIEEDAIYCTACGGKL